MYIYTHISVFAIGSVVKSGRRYYDLIISPPKSNNNDNNDDDNDDGSSICIYGVYHIV